MDGVKEMLKERLESATTEVVALERKVETIQNKYNVFDYDASSFKSFIQDLANHCLSVSEVCFIHLIYNSKITHLLKKMGLN